MQGRLGYPYLAVCSTVKQYIRIQNQTEIRVACRLSMHTRAGGLGAGYGLESGVDGG